jgi:hypothetical protein
MSVVFLIEVHQISSAVAIIKHIINGAYLITFLRNIFWCDLFLSAVLITGWLWASQEDLCSMEVRVARNK